MTASSSTLSTLDESAFLSSPGSADEAPPPNAGPADGMEFWI